MKLNKVPLKSSNFSTENLENEWKSFKRMCIRNYSNVKSPFVFWQRILSYRKDEYSNVCALAEICLVIGVSSSNVERGFSKLTTLLTDKRLSMGHNSMENCLIIAANMNSFSLEEKNEILKSATNSYLQKRRRTPKYAKKVSLVTEEDSGDDEVAIAASSLSVSEVEVNNSEVDDALPEYLSNLDNSDVEMGVDDEFREEQCDEEAED